MNSIRIFVGVLAFSSPAIAAGDGPNWTGYGFHLLNLFILLFVIKLAAGKMIKASVANRAARIQTHLEESNEMRKAAQDRFDQLEARLSHMESEVQGMRDEAAASAEREADLIRKQADADVLRIQEAAEQTIQNETDKARRALRKDAVELALRLAEEKLKSSVGGDEQEALAQDFIGSLKEANGNG
jgi:F-type H+-transporting ATPase subunit b